MDKAVVLLSGGIDSSTTLAVAKATKAELYALSFDYGQRHKIELEAARKVAESLGVNKHLVIKFDLREIGGSALTSDIEVPKYEVQEAVAPAGRAGAEPPGVIPITYVPARNTIFLSFALSWAEVLEASDIYIGANITDYSGYPDCRPEYLKAFEDTANLATKVAVEGRLRFKINAPLLYLSKADIIKKGVALGLDYSMTWSCYDPQPANSRGGVAPWPERNGYIPCRKCDSCIIRARGFKEAGIQSGLCR